MIGSPAGSPVVALQSCTTLLLPAAASSRPSGLMLIAFTGPERTIIAPPMGRPVPVCHSRTVSAAAVARRFPSRLNTTDRAPPT